MDCPVNAPRWLTNVSNEHSTIGDDRNPDNGLRMSMKRARQMREDAHRMAAYARLAAEQAKAVTRGTQETMKRLQAVLPSALRK
jgi:hypothetical protein